LWRDEVVRDVLQMGLKRDAALALGRLMARERGPAVTRSEAERRFAAMVHAAALPPPDHNVQVHGVEVDLLWREQRLVVDVGAYHSGRAAFERDRMRDAPLVALGIRVMRVTWRQIVYEPSAAVAALAQALAVGPE
jgi:very-short-patch-repair endonuclease